MRATWLTDLHLNFLDQARMTAFLATLRREAPEVVLVTGDTAESGDVLEFLEQLGGVAPVYFVLGNHDFYRSTIDEVRGRAGATKGWLPSVGPVRLTNTTTLVGVDGWGDARCGDLESRVVLNDWRWIGELAGLTRGQRNDALQALGAQEATALTDLLARVERSTSAEPGELLVLTHVPPFAEACWYNGRQSTPDWLPWFTCIAVGDVLRAYARQHPATRITVLCGHTHGRAEYRALDNLVVRTGGWLPGEREYGNPIVQATWAVA